MAAITDTERIDRLENIVAVLADHLFPRGEPVFKVPYDEIDQLTLAAQGASLSVQIAVAEEDEADG